MVEEEASFLKIFRILPAGDGDAELAISMEQAHQTENGAAAETEKTVQRDILVASVPEVTGVLEIRYPRQRDQRLAQSCVAVAGNQTGGVSFREEGFPPGGRGVAHRFLDLDE